MTTEVKKDGVSYTFKAPVRAAFLNVIIPKKIGDKGEPTYSASLLLTSDSDDLKGLKAAMAQVAREAFPGRALGELKFPLESGDKEAEKAQARGKDGTIFKGHVVFKPRSDTEHPPALAVKNSAGKFDVLTPTQKETIGPKKFYHGAWVAVTVFLKPYKKGSEGGIGEFSGVKAYLSSIAFIKDGERVGRNAAEEFRHFEGQVSDAEIGADAADEIPF